MADPRELCVWMNGECVGTWQRTRIARVQTLLPTGFPERTAQTIFDGLRRQSRAWEAGHTTQRSPTPG